MKGVNEKELAHTSIFQTYMTINVGEEDLMDKWPLKSLRFSFQDKNNMGTNDFSYLFTHDSLT